MTVDEAWPELTGDLLRGEKWKSRWVYRIVSSDRPIPRAIGESPVIYIGQGNRDRVASLLAEGVRTKHPALHRLVEHNEVRMLRGERPITHVCQAKRSGERAHAGADSLSELEEVFELNRFYRAHGELPLLNSRGEGWLAGRMMKALSRPAAAVKPEPVNWPKLGASYAGGCTNAGDFASWFALVWLWPSEWFAGPVKHQQLSFDLRGYLLLLKVTEDEGVPLPEWLQPDGLDDKGVRLWLPNTRMVACCDARILAGDVLGATSEDLMSFWDRLHPGTSVNGQGWLSDLQRRMDSPWTS